MPDVIEKTPAQRACEAYQAVRYPDPGDRTGWTHPASDKARPAWYAAAQAARSDLVALVAELREQLAAADDATAGFRRQCSELAGELGAAIADRNRLRELLNEASIAEPVSDASDIHASTGSNS